MGQESKSSNRATSAGLTGLIWYAGWLFTIAYANLVWWKILLALVIWPYYLGLSAS